MVGTPANIPHAHLARCPLVCSEQDPPASGEVVTEQEAMQAKPWAANPHSLSRPNSSTRCQVTEHQS